MQSDSQASSSSPGTVLAIVCVGMILANLDLFIVNVGLPDIARDLHQARLEDLSWILNVYAIVYAALLVFFGRLAEGRRRDSGFLLGVAIFTAASAACSASHSLGALVACRAVQAAGAALMTPASLGLLLASFPPEGRGGAVRTWTAVGGFAAALGPVAGGFLLRWSWRWIFFINLPMGIAALAIGKWKLPRVPGHRILPPSASAAGFVTVGTAALTAVMVKGNDWGWTSPPIVGGMALAVAGFLLFVLHCRRSPNPFVDPALFRLRPFTGSSLVLAPYSVAFGGMLLSIVLWEQTVWGWSALKTGLAIAPGPFLVPVTSLLFSKRLIARFGTSSVIAAGILLFVIGMVWWASVPGTKPDGWGAAGAMIPLGIGVGLTFPTAMGVAAASLPPSSFATGSAVINMIRQAALAIGVALFVAIVGSPRSPAARLAAFDRAWWMMAAITATALIPTFVYIHSRPAAEPAFARV